MEKKRAIMVRYGMVEFGDIGAKAARFAIKSCCVLTCGFCGCGFCGFGALALGGGIGAGLLI